MTEHMMDELKKFTNGETFRFDPAVLDELDLIHSQNM